MTLIPNKTQYVFASLGDPQRVIYRGGPVYKGDDVHVTTASGTLVTSGDVLTSPKWLVASAFAEVELHQAASGKSADTGDGSLLTPGSSGIAATYAEGAPLTLTNGTTYFQMTGGVVVAEWVGTAGDVPVQVADLTGTPSTTYTAARQAANDLSYQQAIPRLVLPITACGCPIPGTPVTMGVNGYRLSRCVIPVSGKLRDIAVYVGTTGGNHKALVYDCAATRNKLREGASLAVGASGAWQIIDDPNIDVVAGQQVDIGVMSDSATPTYGRTVSVATATAGAQLPSAYTLGQAALPKLTTVQTAGSYAGPATIAEGTLLITANPLLVIARIS